MRPPVIALASMVLTAVLMQANSQPRLPAFDDYLVKEAYAGGQAKLILESKQDREFRSQLRSAAKQAPNFAGHYIFTTFGCGASCVMGAIIDADNGRVTWLPFTVCCGTNTSTAPIDFRRSSALIVIHGMRDEQGEGTFYYTFQRGHLELIAEYPD